MFQPNNAASEYFLGAYWASRCETVEECANRARQWFDDLNRIGSGTVRWYVNPQGRSSQISEARLEHKQALVSQLLSGRNYTDIGHKVIEELGFGLWLHTRKDDQVSSELNIACGCYSRYVSNCIAFSKVERVIQMEDHACRDLLRSTAAAWNPDWAGIISRDAMDHRGYDARTPFVDWMTYICDEWLPDPPELKAPTTVERLSGGTLIVVQETPPDVDDAAHQRNIQRVQKALKSRLTMGTS